MWYLAYMDEAFGEFVAHTTPWADIFALGADVQLVHSEQDWSGSLHWGDTVHVDVSLEKLGRTSFTIGFAIHSGDSSRRALTASTVYVCIAKDGSGKMEPPPILVDALRFQNAAGS
ncbi:acyl-CoA thioesterase [Skermania sp. ID1734]|nr:acyl-CoA thioesterase [Skermania sp. ID1734]